MIAGARVEVAPYKEDPMDFVLWKPSTDELPGWESPWGRGRPGWHIECSAMAHDLLGSEFDIHGGGNDLTFPHHENEIAQSKCAGHGFAQVWMHNEMLQVEGKKMSKSLGNFFTVRDLLDQGVPGEVIRFVMLSTHYRKPMDWTEKKRAEAEVTLRKWYRVVEGFAPNDVPHWHVVDALNEDLNTPGAISALHTVFKSVEMNGHNRSKLKGSLQLLGLMDDEIPRWAKAAEIDLSELAAKLNGARIEAVQTKDFSQVDALKNQLIDAGLEVRMSKAGVELVPGPELNREKLEALL